MEDDANFFLQPKYFAQDSLWPGGAISHAGQHGGLLVLLCIARPYYMSSCRGLVPGMPSPKT